MNTIEKLDYVLNIINDNKGFISSMSIQEQIKDQIDIDEQRMIISKLFEDGYIVKVIIDGKNNSKTSPPYACQITVSGNIHSKKGGYKYIVKKETISNCWKITKIVANILNSVLVLTIATLGVMIAWQSFKTNSQVFYKGEDFLKEELIIKDSNKPETSIKPVIETIYSATDSATLKTRKPTNH